MDMDMAAATGTSPGPAYHRIGSDVEVVSTPMIVVATIGLLVNLICFRLLQVRQDADLPGVLDRARELLRDRHHISHATMQVEPADHEGCNLVQW